MGTDRVQPFSQRYGLHSGLAVEEDFPASARSALFHVLADLVGKSYVQGWSAVERELDRAARIGAVPEEASYEDSVHLRIEKTLQEMPWVRVYEVIERVYRRLLTSVKHWDQDIEDYIVDASSDQVKAYFADEINDLIGEENLPYRFEDGIFVRPGRYHTQQTTARASKVLGLPELEEARLHYSKARRFFEAAPVADYPNSIKEAVSALESATKSLFGTSKTRDAMALIRSMRGTGPAEIPPTIAKGIEAIYAFRGAASGVAHGGASGGAATSEAAELVLSLSGSYIVYLVDLAGRAKGEAPF